MAYIYSQEGRWDKAIAEYKKLLKMDPADVNIQNMLGDVYVKKGDFQDAFSQYDLCADVYVKQGQSEKASVVNRKISKLDAASLDEASQKRHAVFMKQVEAEEAMENGDTDKAAEAFNTVIQLDPDRFDIYQKLGDLYVQKGDNAMAVKNYFEIGNIYFQNKLYKKASPLFKKIVELDPNHADAQAALGDIYAKDGNESEAKKSFLAIAAATLENRDFDRALIYAKKAVQLKSIEAYYFLGQVYYYQNKLDEAQGELEKLLRFKLNHSGALTFMGKIFVAKKEFDEAISTFERALKGKKDNATALAGMAEAYEGLGEKKEAAENYSAAAAAARKNDDQKSANDYMEKATSLDPDTATASNEGKSGDAPEVTEDSIPELEPETIPEVEPEAEPAAEPEPVKTPVALKETEPIAELPPLTQAPKKEPVSLPPLTEPTSKNQPQAAPQALPPLGSLPGNGPDEILPDTVNEAAPVAHSEADERATLMDLAEGYVSEGNLDESIELYQRILNEHPMDKEARENLHKVYSLIAQQSGIAQGADTEEEEKEAPEATVRQAKAPETGKADTVAQKEEEEAHKRKEAAIKKEEEERKEREAERKKIEEEATRKLEELRRQTEAEEKRLAEMQKAEEESRKKAEAEIRKQVEEEARKKAEEEKERDLAESRKKYEEETNKKIEEELKIKIEGELREKEMRKQQEVEMRARIEKEVRAEAEAEAKIKIEAAQKKAEEDARLKVEASVAKQVELEKKFEAEIRAKKEKEAKARMAMAQERAREILAEEEKLRPTMKPAGSLASLAAGKISPKPEVKAEPKPAIKSEEATLEEQSAADASGEMDEFMTAPVAEIYTKQGLFEEAIRIYQKILVREPANADIKSKLEKLIIQRDGKKPSEDTVSTPQENTAADSSDVKKADAKGQKGAKSKKSKVSYL